MATLRRSDSYRRSDDLPSADQYGDTDSRWSARNSFRRPSGLGHRNLGFPWRTALVALFLFTLGTTFVAAGASHFWHHDRAAAIAFLSVGLVAFLPGAYAAVALVQAVRGVPGFAVHDSTLRVSRLPPPVADLYCSGVLGRLPLVNTFVFAAVCCALMLAGPTGALSCAAKWVPAQYKYQKSRKCNFWKGYRNYKDTKYRWCGEVWGSWRKGRHCDTKWDTTQLSKIGGLSKTCCEDRTDIGTGKCTYDSYRSGHNLY